MHINPALIWDYQFSAEEMQTEHFKKWYVARVLMRGGEDDIRRLGLDTIRAYLPLLDIPTDIREFWQWRLAKKKIT